MAAVLHVALLGLVAAAVWQWATILTPEPFPDPARPPHPTEQHHTEAPTSHPSNPGLGGPARVVALSTCTSVQGAAAINALQRAAAGGLSSIEIRCLTRRPNSQRAQQLRTAGVVVVDGRDGHSAIGAAESPPQSKAPSPAVLRNLLSGATALFLVTFSDFGTGGELDEAAAWGDAAVEHSVGLVIFSGGAPTGIQELDAKARIEAHLRTLPINQTLFLHSSFFYENLVTKAGIPRVAACERASSPQGGNKEVPLGVTFTNPLPHKLPVVMHSAGDLGRAAAAAALDPARFRAGEAVRIVGSRCTPAQFASAYTAATSIEASYVQMDLNTLQSEVFPDDPTTGAAVARMYRAYLDSTLLAEDATMDVAAVRSRFPEATTLETWMQQNGAAAVASACRALWQNETP
eukprot:m.37446 g.37446  ORF g.37446 m.37446 type:complete len:405 (+) comp7699_c0_seq1:36-1250(+)